MWRFHTDTCGRAGQGGCLHQSFPTCIMCILQPNHSFPLYRIRFAPVGTWLIPVFMGFIHFTWRCPSAGLQTVRSSVDVTITKLGLVKFLVCGHLWCQALNPTHDQRCSKPLPGLDPSTLVVVVSQLARRLSEGGSFGDRQGWCVGNVMVALLSHSCRRCAS